MTNRILEQLDRTPSLEIWARPMAIAAARVFLGDPSAAVPSTTELEFWANKWRLSRLLAEGNRVRDQRGLAFRAGRSASLLARPGAVDVSLDRSWQVMGAQLNEIGVAWANTGDSAANRLVDYADQPWPVFYVENIRKAVDEAGLKPMLPGETGRYIRLLPFDGFSEAGRWSDDEGPTAGMWFAAPWQVVMDCYAGVDRMPSQADRIIDGWEAHDGCE